MDTQWAPNEHATYSDSKHLVRVLVTPGGGGACWGPAGGGIQGGGLHQHPGLLHTHTPRLPPTSPPIPMRPGKNSHHIVEATFKAFARALRRAAEYDDRRQGMVASSKGVLTQK
jgi:hypothetical protein